MCVCVRVCELNISEIINRARIMEGICIPGEISGATGSLRNGSTFIGRICVRCYCFGAKYCPI